MNLTTCSAHGDGSYLRRRIGIGLGDEMIQEWEQVACALYDELGSPEAPLSALELARDCGFDVLGGLRGRSRLVGDRIIQIDETVHPAAQHAQVARELARWGLLRFGLRSGEEASAHVAAALLLPRVVFQPELEQTLDPEVHSCRHPYVALELLARRMASLGDLLVSVWREGRLVERFAPAYLEPGRPARTEREIAARARLSARPVVAGELRAYAVHEGAGGIDVVSLAPARVLVDLSDARHYARFPEVVARR